MPDKLNCTPEVVPSSERDDGRDYRHGGLPLTKVRGLPESPHGKTRSSTRGKPSQESRRFFITTDALRVVTDL
jgi:hypothetical protein